MVEIGLLARDRTGLITKCQFLNKYWIAEYRNARWKAPGPSLPPVFSGAIPAV
jgi:hypothetical protein